MQIGGLIVIAVVTAAVVLGLFVVSYLVWAIGSAFLSEPTQRGNLQPKPLPKTALPFVFIGSALLTPILFSIFVGRVPNSALSELIVVSLTIINLLWLTTLSLLQGSNRHQQQAD